MIVAVKTMQVNIGKIFAALAVCLTLVNPAMAKSKCANGIDVNVTVDRIAATAATRGERYATTIISNPAGHSILLLVTENRYAHAYQFTPDGCFVSELPNIDPDQLLETYFKKTMIQLFPKELDS